ncbi:MAG: hypothetical protein C4567_12035 [Deltaproteobacteria bacterium]|nr:MAG: hypothetical protein C4567_12035 [Deltaproteobacteria bacterium]
MPEGRGKKTKKAKWQLILGLKQVVCGALGLTWLMLIIFVLGVLAGRGDIYRWFSSWGLITPDAPRMAQWSPPPEPAPAAAPAPTPAAPGTQAQSKVPQTPPAAAPAQTETVPGTMIPTSSPAPGVKTKKEKKGVAQRDREARDKELQRLRREVAAKLKFQNSFDTKPPKTVRTASKKKEKAAAAAPAAKAQAAPVRVAQFRDPKAAKAKLAELQKKGEKVSLKQGKDKKGAVYNIVRETPANPKPADALAQKTQKSSGNKPQKPAAARN